MQRCGKLRRTKIPVPRPPSLGIKATQDTAAKKFTEMLGEVGHSLFAFKGGIRCKKCQAWKSNGAFKEWLQEACNQTTVGELPAQSTEPLHSTAPAETVLPQREPQDQHAEAAEEEG